MSARVLGCLGCSIGVDRAHAGAIAVFSTAFPIVPITSLNFSSERQLSGVWHGMENHDSVDQSVSRLIIGGRSKATFRR